ncbi:hypothetical protein [Escherichia sp. TW09276]|nr:hypothetical protein [Escherichia sp. TW09276]
MMQVYRFIVEDELKRGELIELLTVFAGTSRPFMIVYPYKRQVL